MQHHHGSVAATNAALGRYHLRTVHAPILPRSGKTRPFRERSPNHHPEAIGAAG
jgi:hypothetical protein